MSSKRAVKPGCPSRKRDLGKVLASNGYAADTKTFFILEGVTQYLTEAGIQKTFEFLAKAPAGSRLVFTYIPKDFMDGKVFYGHEYMYKKMVLKKIWLFGIDPEAVADFLGGYGWRVLEQILDTAFNYLPGPPAPPRRRVT